MRIITNVLTVLVLCFSCVSVNSISPKSKQNPNEVPVKCFDTTFIWTKSFEKINDSLFLYFSSDLDSSFHTYTPNSCYMEDMPYTQIEHEIIENCVLVDTLWSGEEKINWDKDKNKEKDRELSGKIRISYVYKLKTSNNDSFEIKGKWHSQICKEEVGCFFYSIDFYYPFIN